MFDLCIISQNGPSVLAKPYAGMWGVGPWALQNFMLISILVERCVLSVFCQK